MSCRRQSLTVLTRNWLRERYVVSLRQNDTTLSMDPCLCICEIVGMRMRPTHVVFQDRQAAERSLRLCWQIDPGSD